MDTEYILDCAFECGEITSVERAVLESPLGAYGRVRELIDNNLHMPEHFLENTARARLEQGSLSEKYFFALCGLNGLQFGLKTFEERACHVLQNKFQQDLGLAKPLLVGLYPETSEATQLPALKTEAELSEGVARQTLNHMFGPIAARWTQDFQLMSEAIAWYQQDDGAAFNAMLHAQCLDDFGTDPESSAALQRALATKMRAVKAVEAKNRTIRGKAKSAIKKATKLFQGLGQEENLTLFVSGHEVTLANPTSNFKFILKPLQESGWLLDRTSEGRAHTPYELSWYTKDDVFLANLCVYFKDTPVLDQLLALSLFVSAGDEHKVLEKANWYAVSDWTPQKTDVVLASYPQLETKVPKHLANGKLVSRHPQICIPRAQLAQETHWLPFKGRMEQWVATWMEPATRTATRLSLAIPGLAQKIQHVESLNRTVAVAAH